MNAAIAPLAALLTTALLTPLVRRFALRSGHLDVPNERSSHVRPTPRTGGWAIVAGIVAGVAAGGAFAGRGIAVAVVAAILLAALAIIDERADLPRMLRLVLQIGVAVLTPIAAGIALQRLDLPFASIPLGWAAIPLSVFWIVGVTNGYNFMDGLNGISSVEAIVCGATMGTLALRSGDAPAAALALALGAAALGFLPWNASGSIFMGDTGSATFGFLFAALALRLTQNGTPIVAAALPLLPFLLDSGVTLVRRALRGERFFSTPHRSHFYQHLQQQGWPHLAVSALYGALALCSGIAALQWEALTQAGRLLALGALLALHAAVFAVIEWRWTRLVSFRASKEQR
jgi:UDP-GlcNAc:undecaprenyl-phosphate GlcNAc-1-phosphate transferase